MIEVELAPAPDEGHRIEEYMRLRFMPTEAEILARTKRDDGTYLRVTDVKEWLTEGATPKQILALYAPL